MPARAEEDAELENVEFRVNRQDADADAFGEPDF